MSNFEIAKAQDILIRLALVGPSGSGKTYTALSLATTMFPEKVAIIDTEKRSSTRYAKLFNFYATFPSSHDPDHLIELIKEAEASGIKCVIIDSLSHYWNGIDGVLEQVDRATERKAASGQKGSSFNLGWKDVKPLERRMFDALTGCGMHVIVTMRSKTEYVTEAGRMAPQKVGLAPVQRDDIEYEFDIVGYMDQKNTLWIQKTRCIPLTGKSIPRPDSKFAALLKTWANEGNIADANGVQTSNNGSLPKLAPSVYPEPRPTGAPPSSPASSKQSVAPSPEPPAAPPGNPAVSRESQLPAEAMEDARLLGLDKPIGWGQTVFYNGKGDSCEAAKLFWVQLAFGAWVDDQKRSCAGRLKWISEKAESNKDRELARRAIEWRKKWIETPATTAATPKTVSAEVGKPRPQKPVAPKGLTDKTPPACNIHGRLHQSGKITAEGGPTRQEVRDYYNELVADDTTDEYRRQVLDYLAAYGWVDTKPEVSWSGYKESAGVTHYQKPTAPVEPEPEPKVALSDESDETDLGEVDPGDRLETETFAIFETHNMTRQDMDEMSNQLFKKDYVDLDVTRREKFLKKVQKAAKEWDSEQAGEE